MSTIVDTLIDPLVKIRSSGKNRICVSPSDPLSNRLCNPGTEELEGKLCATSTDQVCGGHLPEMKYTCATCGGLAPDAGHLCDPKKVIK